MLRKFPSYPHTDARLFSIPFLCLHRRAAYPLPRRKPTKLKTKLRSRFCKLASFNLNTRVWRRLMPEPATGETASDVRRTQTFPAPRAFHASWAFGNDVYVHGGEGPIGARTGYSPEGLEYEDIMGGVGRDPFAEDDGGAPLGPGRVAVAGHANKVGSGSKLRGTEEMPQSASKRHTMSVLEDLWKFDTRTRRWERVSWPARRNGSTRSTVGKRVHVVSLVFWPCHTRSGA